MPAMARALAATPADVQLTLSVYMFGWGAAQLVAGPVSDRFGRKPVLAWGLVVFTLASVACAMSRDIATLIAWRFVQAVAMATVVVVPRAIVRDLFAGDRAAHALSTMMLVLSVAPVLAPILGAELQPALRLAIELRPGGRVRRAGVGRGRVRAAGNARPGRPGCVEAFADARQLEAGASFAAASPASC